VNQDAEYHEAGESRMEHGRYLPVAPG